MHIIVHNILTGEYIRGQWGEEKEKEKRDENWELRTGIGSQTRSRANLSEDNTSTHI